MKQVSLTGKDTILIDDILLTTGGADATVGEITYPNELANLKVGKDGNTVVAHNAMGELAEMKYRCLRGSVDDVYLNGRLLQYQAFPPAFVMMTGKIVKRIGTGLGFFRTDLTILGAGLITRNPANQSNVEGDTEQAVVTYEFKFASSKRTIS